MKNTLNETHDSGLKSWITAANADTDFPIQNLPLGIFRRAGTPEPPRVGAAIGDHVLDLAACQAAGLLTGPSAQAGALAGESSLNALMGLQPRHLSALRRRLSELLRSDGAETGRKDVAKALVPMSQAEMLLPAVIGDYTDFYASIHHATNVGRLFRPDQPLLPNYKHVPIGYHGRASSIVVSGTAFHRPSGQRKADADPGPVFGPTRSLDYEVELGLFAGPGNALGEPIPIHDAADHIFGFCLLNDWSARDMQKWEYQPLGPFLGKSFATTVSPWVVTLEALEPFRVPNSRPEGDPQPLAYLQDPEDQRHGGFDVTLELFLSSSTMRAGGLAPMRLSRSQARDLYWTPAQMVAHHASNGCNLRPGDLLGSGTLSGASADAMGCLLELTAQGKNPITLPNGEERRFLEDGDEVILTGRCRAEGFAPIGFGACAGRVLPAK